MKLNRLSLISSVGLILALLTSCGQQQQSGQQSQSYKDMKTMVLDVLNTEDGHKAISEAQKKNTDKTTQLLSTGEGQKLQMAVKEVLTDPNQSKLLEQTMKDPKFAGAFAKAIQKENAQLHKELMKDPDYQKQMLELMKNQEFENLLLDTMRSQQYRQQAARIMQESMQSPLIRMQIVEMLQKVVEEESAKQKPRSDQQGQGKKGGGGGGEGGGEGGEGGGGGGGEGGGGGGSGGGQS
ncbi:spore germination protein GerD [Paenibacillus sp. J31TS4]|nr:spore germination protein GerD [Paenibacillus sp. J31TS4]